MTAEVVDGNLLLHGDRLSNWIELRAARDGTPAIEIIGLPSEDGDLTTINGDTSVIIDGVTGDITAIMRGGDDAVYIHDLDLPGDFNANTGGGNDRVLIGGIPRGGDGIGEPLSDGAVDQAMASADLVAPGDGVDPVPVDPVQPVDPAPLDPHEPVPVDPVPILPIANVTIAGQAHIVTGGGTDAVTMGSVEVYNNLTINTGRHTDIIRLGINELALPTDVPAGDLAVGDVGPPINLPVDVYGSLRMNTGGGNDQVWLESVHVAGNMQANLGGGDDVLSYDWGGVAGRISVSGGAGDDLVALVHVAADTIRVNTQRGNDGVGLIGVSARRINVHLGAGDDQLLVSDASASTARFDGGGGTDTLMFQGSNHFRRLRALSFEIIS